MTAGPELAALELRRHVCPVCAGAGALTSCETVVRGMRRVDRRPCWTCGGSGLGRLAADALRVLAARIEALQEARP